MAQSMFDKQSEAIIQAANIQAVAVSQAAATQMAMARESIAFQKEQNQIARETLEPFVQAGQAGTDQLQSLLGLKGFEAEQEAAQGVLEGGAFQEAAKFGQQALERSAAARGGLQTGRFASELNQLGQNQAFGQIQQRIGNLQALGSQGVGAAGGSAQLAQQLGQNVAGVLQHQGDVQSQFNLAQGQLAASSLLATSPASEMAFNMANAQQNIGGIAQAGGLGSFGSLGGAQGGFGGGFF